MRVEWDEDGHLSNLHMRSYALGVTVHTLCAWEQSREVPEGLALALLRIAARHPRIIRENIASVA